MDTGIKTLHATMEKVENLNQISEPILTEPIQPGKWSIREIVGHMYYWDKHNLEKMIPAMTDNATLPAFPDHDSHNTKAITYIEQFKSSARIVEAFVQMRKAFITALTQVGSKINFYIENEPGIYTMERFARIFAEHDLHHLQQIENHLYMDAGEVQPSWRSESTERLDDFIAKHPHLQGALIGVNVCNAKDGSTIYEHMADTRLHPASNMKLLTAAAALEILEKDYVWTTEIWMDGEIIKNELRGNLYIKGKGDPTLLPSDLNGLAMYMYDQLGIRKITGDVIADDTWYDDVRLSPDMMWSDEHCYYGAQVSALTLSPDDDYDTGTVKISVQPGMEAGAPVQVSLYPDTDYISIENHAVTATGKSDEVELEIIREHGTNTVIISGEINLDSESQNEWIAVWEPTVYVSHVWKDSLVQAGIHISGNAKVGDVPLRAKYLTQHESITLSDLLIPFMKLSNNGLGEILVKEMGKIVKGEGSWEKGMEVLVEEAASLGVDTDQIILRDGSGISHVNLIASQQLTNLLYRIQEKSWFDTFYRSLPVGGKEDRMVGGTLRERLSGKNIVAKTGTIFGVSTLSGYMQTVSGKRFIFSIMLNNLLDEDAGPDIEDGMIDILADD